MANTNRGNCRAACAARRAGTTRVEVQSARVEGGHATALALLPGALIVFMGFNAGGYFPSAPATGVVVLALALLVRIVRARHPFEGLAPVTIIASARSPRTRA